MARSQVVGTASGKMYCDLPDANRTAFVVGMADMLGATYRYAAPEYKPRLAAMLQFLLGHENVALRQRFDAYMNVQDVRQTLKVAGSFLSALNEWSGFDEQKPAATGSWFGWLQGKK